MIRSTYLRLSLQFRLGHPGQGEPLVRRATLENGCQCLQSIRGRVGVNDVVAGQLQEGLPFTSRG
jgi:hypothetical protein